MPTQLFLRPSLCFVLVFMFISDRMQLSICFVSSIHRGQLGSSSVPTPPVPPAPAVAAFIPDPSPDSVLSSFVT